MSEIKLIEEKNHALQLYEKFPIRFLSIFFFFFFTITCVAKMRN